MALCDVGHVLCTFLKADFLKRKLKLKLSLAHFQRQNIIGSRTHTQTHTSTEMLSDENDTKAPCATDFIVYPRQCACKIFEHVIA